VAEQGRSIPVVRIGWPDEFIPHAATNGELLERYGLTAEKIADRILAKL